MKIRLRPKDIALLQTGFTCRIKRPFPLSDIEIYLDKEAKENVGD